MNTKILLFLIAFAVASESKSYQNHKVYNVVPKSESEVIFVKNLQTQVGIEFWEDEININQATKIMVSPEKQNNYESQVKDKVESVLVIEDVQRLIDEQLKPRIRQGRNEGYSFEQYHILDDIYSWLDSLADLYPNIVSTVIIGRTIEGRDIKGVIMNFRGDSNNLTAMIEGGIHAREWISPATVTWIINEFLTSDDPEIRSLADNFEWHIFPAVNPDGYSYTFTDMRMWRKNRNTENFKSCVDLGSDDDMSNGIDLNRNFNVEWLGEGASNDSCSNTFAGKSPASELETRAISAYAEKLSNEGELIYYIAFHSYSQLMLIPYSHVSSANELEGVNYADMFEIASRGSERAERRFGTHYKVGLSANLMYPMSGTSFDYVKYATNAPLCYLIELRDLGKYGFLLPPDQIIPVGLEMMDSLVEMDKTSRHLGYYSAATCSKFSFLALALSFILVNLFK